MRKVKVYYTRMIERNESTEGESIEEQMRRVKNGDTIEFGKREMLYTKKSDGVLPETDIRTDRMEVARMALDSVEKTRAARGKDLIIRDGDQATIGGEKKD